MIRGLSLALLLAGCNAAQAQVDPAPVAPQGPDARRWVRATEAQGATRWEVPGVVRTDGLGAAELTAPLRVRVARVLAVAGDRVEEGQALAEVEVPELVRALGARAAASGRVTPLRAWRQEVSAQRDGGYVRVSEQREVEARLADAEAELRRAEAELRASGASARDLSVMARTGRLVLRAPIAGVLREVSMVPGRVVDPGDPPLAQILGARPARVEMRVSAPWPAGASLSFVPLRGDALELDPSPISESVDPSTGARLVWLRARSTAALSPGSLGRVVVSALPAGVVEVPARALLREGGGARVLLRGGPRAVTVLSVTAHSALVRGVPVGTEVAAEADLGERAE